VTNPTSLPDFALFRECDGCPEMVVMPAGTFTMGSPAGEAGRGTDEGPQRNVNIRRFAISRFETTWDQWTACVSAGACNQGPIDTLIGQQTWARDAANWGRGQRPAIMVDWNDAAAYAVFVRGRAGGAAYRLPTESEWEYAARAGTSTRWSFGDTESQLGAYAWFSSNAGSKTQPVGGKAANPWGLFDMHGNVWEWVEDCYVNSYSGLATNGAANTTGDCAFRVFRGGSWYVNPRYLRSAIRSGSSPTNRSYSVGFRLSRTL
jgi:formylglycine-generating enzyme required for sulfatase activity